MNELNIMKKVVTDPYEGTPFLGEVPSLLHGSSLAATIGLGSGTLINEMTPWLKFLYKGKTLYMPKMPVRTGVTWTILYELGAVHGDDTNGVKNANSYNTLQNRKTTIAGKQYRIRLPAGAPTNPYTGSLVTDAAALGPCEWNDLFYPILTDAGIVTYTGKKIQKPYTPDQLGFNSIHPGNQNLTRNLTSLTTTGAKLTRGNRTSVAAASNVGSCSVAQAEDGWRPVIELIP